MKRPSLRDSLPPTADEDATLAVAQVRELQRRQGAEQGTNTPMTASTIHIPVDLLDALRAAAFRRASRRMKENPKGRGGRPSVSEIVVEMLTLHRAELDALD